MTLFDWTLPNWSHRSALTATALFTMLAVADGGLSGKLAFTQELDPTEIAKIGNQELERGDLTSAVAWYLRASRADTNDRQWLHALRFQLLLDQLPHLKGVWPSKASDEKLSTISISPDGKRLLIPTSASTVRVYDTSTGQPCGREIRSDGHIADSHVAANGECIWIRDSDGSVLLHKNEEIKSLRAGYHRSASELQRSPCGRFSAVISDDRSVVSFFDANQGDLLKSFEADPQGVKSIH